MFVTSAGKTRQRPFSPIWCKIGPFGCPLFHGSGESFSSLPPILCITVRLIVSSLPANVTNRYRFIAEIGNGGEGGVYKVAPTRPGAAEAVAVKVIRGNSFDRCQEMLDIWRDLTYPYVVSLRWAYYDSIERQCIIEMELLSIDLCNYIVRE